MSDSRPPIDRTSFTDYYSGVLGGGVFRWIDIRKVRALERILKSADMAESKVLDLGGGAGSVPSKLSRCLPRLRITVADSDPGLLRSAGQNGLETAEADFNARLPFPDAGFDAVIMVDSIEHVECRRETMREVRRVLAPPGLFVVFTPPYDTMPWLVGERLHRLVTRRKADHITPFTRESLEWLLASHFEKWTIKYLNCGLTLLGWGLGMRSE